LAAPEDPQKTATGANPNDHQMSTIPALSIRFAKIHTATVIRHRNRRRSTKKKQGCHLELIPASPSWSDGKLSHFRSLTAGEMSGGVAFCSAVPTDDRF